MGYRTVVILSNDQAHEWMNDPELGRKIIHASSDVTEIFNYGSIAECVHADTQTIGIIDSYNFAKLATDHWRGDQLQVDLQLKMVKAAAKHLGYRLVKKKHPSEND